MSEKVDKAFNDLKLGFIFSFFALFVTILYSIAFLKSYFLHLSFPSGLPLFLLLLTWAYGLAKRVEGWSLLNQKSVSLALICGTITLFTSFSLATAQYIIPSRGIYPVGTEPQLLFAVLSYAGALVAPIAWGVYTVFESWGFRMIKQNYGINLTSAQICSLIGILVLVFIDYLSGLTLPSLVIAFLSASPFLIVSCILTFLKLRKNSKVQNKYLKR